MPNQLECTVTEVIGKPEYTSSEFWCQQWKLKVKYDCYGVESEHDLYFSTKEEADEVKVGYIFETMF